jgi:hypothetical protein
LFGPTDIIFGCVAPSSRSMSKASRINEKALRALE